MGIQNRDYMKRPDDDDRRDSSSDSKLEVFLSGFLQASTVLHLRRHRTCRLDRCGYCRHDAYHQGSVSMAGRLSGWQLRSGEKGGDGIGKTKRGKGTKWMVVVDGQGIPLGSHLDGAKTGIGSALVTGVSGDVIVSMADILQIGSDFAHRVGI